MIYRFVNIPFPLSCTNTKIFVPIRYLKSITNSKLIPIINW